MTESFAAPGGELSEMRRAAEEIVSGLFKEKPGLVDEAAAAFEEGSVADLGTLLGIGDGVAEDQTELAESNLDDTVDTDDEDIIVADDEDVESIMRELIEEHPEFEDVEEEVRRQIVVDAIIAALAEES
jgi:hypothetical protein